MRYRQNINLFITLLFFWLIIAGEINLRQLVSGGICAAITLVIYTWILENTGANRIRWIPLGTALRFFLVVLAEIFKSGIQHLGRIVSGRGPTLVCRLHLRVEDDIAATLIANGITLTPGTVALEVDRRIVSVLYYGDIPNQCPMDLLLMAERLQQPFLDSGKGGGHA